VTLQPYKFVVRAVIQQLGDEGEVVQEIEGEPVVVFGCEALACWARDFPAKLAGAEEQVTHPRS
jgi:hypothetical protein